MNLLPIDTDFRIITFLIGEYRFTEPKSMTNSVLFFLYFNSKGGLDFLKKKSSMQEPDSLPRLVPA